MRAFSTSASRVFPLAKKIIDQATNIHKGEKFLHSTLKSDHIEAPPLSRAKPASNSQSQIPNSKSIDNHYISQILARKDWHLLLKHEFKAGRVPLNPRTVVSVLQNQAHPFSSVKFFVWVSNVEPSFEKDRSVRTVLANTLHRKGPVLLTSELVEVIRASGFRISEDLLCVLIGSWGRLGLGKYCCEIFGQIHYIGLCPTTRLYNALLDALVKSNSIDLAYLKFQQMPADNCSPDRFTYNILIHGVCKNGVVDEALRLLRQMENSGYSANVYTLTILVDGFCNSNRVDEAFRLLEEMSMKKVKPSEATYRSLVHGVFRSVEPKKALELLCRFVDQQAVMPKVACDAILHHLSNKSLAREATAFLQKVREKGYVLDSSVCNITITCLIKNLPAIEVCQILDSFVNQDMKPALTSYLALIGALFKDGKEKEGNRYLVEVLKTGLVSNAFSYNMLLDCLCNNSLTDRALEIFRGMKQNKITPNLATLNTLIHGFLKAGDVTRARELLVILLEHGFKPDNFTFSSIIDGLCMKNKMEDAFDCFAEMKEWGVPPNNITYNILIRSLCVVGDVGRAVALFNEMQKTGISPDTYTFNALIRSMCRINHVDNAQKHFLSMVTLGLKPDSITYSTLVESLCRLGRFSEAEEIFFSMKLSGCTPDTYTCNSFIDTLKKLGHVKEAEFVARKCKELGLIGS
ncbi:hypothetical protein V2J09_011405 [Rumex salicifolius]